MKFIVEEDSPQTVAAVERHALKHRYHLIVVPRAQPHTKPKALNFALPLTKGEFVTVYDAEDVPEPTQLRRTAARFAADPRVGCIQAELVAENAGENAMTALFAAEYGGLFGILLPSLARWGFPMPLGGTSNHFRRDVLMEIGGWDAFNVTEDADLGLRLARRRIRAATISAYTLEEAPVSLVAWFRQRTRWMKGWMQTFLVHNRRPFSLLRDLGLLNFLAFEIYVCGMFLTPPLHTFYMLALAVRTAMTGMTLPGADVISLAEAFTFTVGYGSAILISILGVIRLGKPHLVLYQLLLPVYWALMGLAAMRAAVELVRNPYFWSKTSHGVSKLKRGSMAGRSAEQGLGTGDPIERDA